MKAEELRIGNYVYYNDKVISIAPNAIKEFYYIGDTHSESLVDRRCYEPIELTEDVLLKCGFEKDGNFYYIKSFKSIYLSRPWLEANHLLLKTLGGECISNVKYLHQLQNLYFALTNEELIINL